MLMALERRFHVVSVGDIYFLSIPSSSGAHYKEKNNKEMILFMKLQSDYLYSVLSNQALHYSKLYLKAIPTGNPVTVSATELMKLAG